jgi:hypothetical protein
MNKNFYTFQKRFDLILAKNEKREIVAVFFCLLSFLIMKIQGVSEIRVLILTSGRTRQIMELFSITFLRKNNTN